MAGRGPAPKDPARRAGKAKDTTPKTSIRFVGAEQPELPPLPDGEPWHPRTVQWWATWRDAPQAEHFMATDWDFLVDTALMHNAMWTKGQWTLAQEVRLRVAKYGATPEDRARLRMHFADADEKDAKRPAAPPQRWGDLRALPGAREA
jgi:hypothetical protein